jgi:Mg/Co/Ni transporter MgtE
MSKLVRDAMTVNPRTVGLKDSVVDAAHIMEQEDVGSVPVVDTDNILVGMITDRDITLRVVPRERIHARQRRARSQPSRSAPHIRTSRSMRRSSRWLIGRFAGCR